MSADPWSASEIQLPIQAGRLDLAEEGMLAGARVGFKGINETCIE